MREGKPLTRRVGFWGSIGSLFSLISAYREVLESIPPELIDETKLTLWALGAAISAVVAIIGRWRATLKIDSWFFSDKRIK